MSVLVDGEVPRRLARIVEHRCRGVLASFDLILDPAIACSSPQLGAMVPEGHGVLVMGHHCTEGVRHRERESASSIDLRLLDLETLKHRVRHTSASSSSDRRGQS